MVSSKKIIIVFAVILAVVLIGSLIQSFIVGNVAKEKSQGDWLSENCNCTERNYAICPADIPTYKDGYCTNPEKKTTTNPMKGCSKYNCLINGTNEIYELNQKLQRWNKVE
jgi:hypothetical protein